MEPRFEQFIHEKQNLHNVTLSPTCQQMGVIVSSARVARCDDGRTARENRPMTLSEAVRTIGIVNHINW